MAVETKDCNGKVLSNGDKVMVNKTLDVKGSSITIKRGEKIKNIRLIGDSNAVECRIGKATLVLKTQFLKKV